MYPLIQDDILFVGNKKVYFKTEVSILMAVYNEPVVLLKDSLESILKSANNISIEIIIGLDNDPHLVPDLNSYLIQLSQDYKSVRYFANSTNLGLAMTLNKAFEISTGKFIARMDADDLAINDRIIKQLNFLENGPFDFVFCDSYFFYDGDDSETFRRNYWKINDKYLLSSLLSFDYAYHTCWFFKRSVFESLNGYSNLEVSQDYDFLIRLIAKGFKIGFQREPLMKIRLRSGSTSSRKAYKQYIVSSNLINSYKNNNLFNEFRIMRLATILNNIEPMVELTTLKLNQIINKKSKIIILRLLDALIFSLRDIRLIKYLVFIIVKKLRYNYYIYISKFNFK
jgi:glycosyltransferase involved in cell wall biosynthesis